MNEDVAETPCPGCGQKALRIEWRLKATSFSLSGQSMKVSTSEVPWLVCGNCGIEAEGKQ